MKGRRKYTCGDCKADTWFHWVEINRRGRIKCSACGSIRLEPKTDDGKEDRLVGQANVLDDKYRMKRAHNDHPNARSDQ